MELYDPLVAEHRVQRSVRVVSNKGKIARATIMADSGNNDLPVGLNSDGSQKVVSGCDVRRYCACPAKTGVKCAVQKVPRDDEHGVIPGVIAGSDNLAVLLDRKSKCGIVLI